MQKAPCQGMRAVLKKFRLLNIISKCDLGRPSCQRCVNGKRECTGVPLEGDVLFKDQNRMVVTLTRKRTEQRAQKQGSIALPNQPSSSSSPLNERSGSPTEIGLQKIVSPEEIEAFCTGPNLVKSPTPLSLQSLATMFWFQKIQSNTGSTIERSQFLASLINLHEQSSDDKNLVKLTVSANAISVLSKHAYFAKYRPMARKMYGEAIELVGKAISHPKTATSNPTIMAVLFLASFEVSISSRLTK